MILLFVLVFVVDVVIISYPAMMVFVNVSV